MDTELKKYKRDTFKRVIAVLICLLCISGMTSQVMSSIDKAEAQGLVYVNFTDAMNYDVMGIERNEWLYTSFRNGYTLLLGFLETKMNEFGNGTEKDYKKRLKEYEQNLDKEIDFYKDRIIYAAVNYFTDFAELYHAGIIEITGVYSTKEGSENSLDTNIFTDVNFNFHPFREMDGVVTEPAMPRSVSDEFKNIEYDNVRYFKETGYVYDVDDDELLIKFKPGYYAFKVNREELKKQLLSSDTVRKYYSSYEEFYEQYLQSEKRIKAHAGTVRYFIRDNKGNTITNIEDLDAKSKAQKVKDYFENFDTYSYSQNGAIYLSDGMYYSDTYLDWFENNRYAYQDEDYVPVVHTTMSEITAAVVNTTLVNTTDENGETITAVVPTTVTEAKMYINEFGEPVSVPETTRVATPMIQEERITANDIELYIAFDKDADYETCHFAMVRYNVAIAKELIIDCLFTCGILGILLLACIFYLIAITGKRKGSKEIHLYRTDKNFPEIRTAIDGGLGFLCVCGIFYFLEVYLDSHMKTAIGLCILVLVILLFLICLDLILYLARHIKNRSLLKNIFIVWLIRKFIKYGKRIKTFVNGRLLYAKNLNKTVIIRTAIVVGINVLIGGTALMFWLAEIFEIGAMIIIALFIFDLYIVYRGLRFVGGVDKLFSAVKELHEGNTDINIEKNALPDYLYLPAENLQCLSEGIKAAVNEAVKQEKTKTELITNVSHDLKTPLTSIINYVDLMKKCDITDETALSYLQVLSEKSDRLKVLIEDLVEASKASAGALSVDFVCVNCRELISQIIGEFEDSFEEKRLKVIFSLPESDLNIRADSKHIYRVMENLFVNVRKYALENTRVYITVTEREDKGIINIKNISAAPLNISADELKERFVRGEQSRTTEGNGLGLSIAENLCTLQNGSLNIEISGDLFSVSVEMEKYR